MKQPWGDPDKIIAAEEFADCIIGKIPELEAQMPVSLCDLHKNKILREKFFTVLLKEMKEHHHKGAYEPADAGYLINKVMSHLYPEKYIEVTNLFYSDGLFEKVDEIWRSL